MSGAYTDHLVAKAVVYDCMDELAAFKNAPPSWPPGRRTALGRADLVFTGGMSLYESKQRHHRSIPSPSSVDLDHFAKARKPCLIRPTRPTSRIRASASSA